MTIVANRLSPLTQIAFDNSQAGANAIRKPTILMGQTLLPQALALIPAFSKAQVQALCGRGSMLDRMFQFYYALDNDGPIYIAPLADAAGAVAATGFLLLNGIATAAGSLATYIAGQLVAVAVNLGDTAVVVAANLVTAVNAALDLPVTATAVAASDTTLRRVQFTARHLGTMGNRIDLRVNYGGARNGESLPPGLSAVITNMNGGATDPDISAAFTMIGDAPGRFFLHPYAGSAALTAGANAMSFTGGRWSPTRKAWGHVFTANRDTKTNLMTFAAGNDDPHLSVFAYESGSPTPPWEAVAIWVGGMAGSLRAQPNLPVQTLPLNGFLPPTQQPDAMGGPFVASTREAMLGVGLGVARYDRGVPQIVRAVTSYTTNLLGVPDQSYQDTEDMFLLMELADRIDAWQTQKYARALVADNGTKAAPGLPVVTPRSFLADMVGVYSQMEFDGLVDDAADFINASSVVRNLTSPGELDVTFAPYLVVGLRQIGTTIQFRKISAAAQALTGITGG